MSQDPNKRVTAREIAESLGVSKATVSYVMNGRGGVSEKVADLVRQRASELGYMPNQAAKSVRTGKSNTVGLILPDLSNPFFPKLAQGAQKAAAEAGYALLLVDARNSVEAETIGLEQLVSHAVDGIMWCPVDDDHLAAENSPCPMIMIDRPKDGFDSVFADAEQGGRLQGEYVLSQGHKTVGILSGPIWSPGATFRRDGLYKAIGSSAEIRWDYAVDYSASIPPEIAKLAVAGDVSCIICANDTIAIGTMRLLRDAGLVVPDDISIIGFDDIDWCELMVPRLTTVHLPIAELGLRAFDLLINRIENPDSEKVEAKLPVHFVAGATVKNMND